MALSDADLQRGQRIKAVRDARGETQPQFARRLEELLKVRYDAGEVSRLETGNRVASWEVIRAVAQLDPEKRGRDWLGWDDDPEAGLQGARTKPTGPAPRGSGSPDPIVERLADRLSRAEQPKDARRKRRGR